MFACVNLYVDKSQQAAAQFFLDSLWQYYMVTRNSSRMSDRGEREFPFPVIPGNTSLKFPFPWHFVISLPVPGKRNFWPGIKTGNTINFCSLADGWSRHENKWNVEFNLAFYLIPGNSRDSRDYKHQISHSLPVAFSNSRSLPVKREWDFQFPFPFPGAKKPFPRTPAYILSTLQETFRQVER